MSLSNTINGVGQRSGKMKRLSYYLELARRLQENCEEMKLMSKRLTRLSEDYMKLESEMEETAVTCTRLCAAIVDSVPDVDGG